MYSLLFPFPLYTGIQIHFSNDNHWTTSSYVDECVHSCDSLSSGLSANVEEQLARIYGRLDKSEEDRGLTLHHVPVQQQSGNTDCGVFAVAFAYHAAIGDAIERITFDQGQMRNHLLRCFEEKKLSRFPHKLICSRGKFKFQFIALHCYDHCKLPESYDNLIGCDSCDQWYHYKCNSIVSSALLPTAWFCKNCQQ